MQPDEEPVRIPITSELDLHTFAPREVATVIKAYLDECRAQGIFTVRIIHGKGTGTLRETTHAVLCRLPDVAGFHLADAVSGGWGATWVTLRRL